MCLDYLRTSVGLTTVRLMKYNRHIGDLKEGDILCGYELSLVLNYYERDRNSDAVREVFEKLINPTFSLEETKHGVRATLTVLVDDRKNPPYEAHVSYIINPELFERFGLMAYAHTHTALLKSSAIPILSLRSLVNASRWHGRRCTPRRGGILEYVGRAYVPQASYKGLPEEPQEQEER